MFKAISNFIARLDTRTLVNILSGIGILCIVSTTLIAPKYIGNPFQDLMIASRIPFLGIDWGRFYD